MANYFIVKHDLESFLAMPGFIWRIGLPRKKTPRGFAMIEQGDRWIEFAYEKGWDNDEKCSIVAGFYECTDTHWYGRIPVEELDGSSLDAGRADFIKESIEGKNAHMIRGGKCDGYQPRHPVTVLSINELLGRTIVGMQTIVRITRKEFTHIRNQTQRRELDPGKIPFLKREPLNEQEVLCAVVGDVVSGRKKLGIEKIVWARTRFPDMLVRINGEEVYLELEFDSLGFWDHINKKQLRRIRDGNFKGKWEAKVKDKDDDRPVAVLCWVDNDREHELRKDVPCLRVFELQSLLRDGKKIGGKQRG
ncbi:MAG: hypothetical protein ABSF26_12450 [Thermoguttaceae bacterium]|jgi:hypothetical protein